MAVFKLACVGLPVAAFLAACSGDREPAAPASVAANGPAISTTADCTSGFTAAKQGLRVILDGRTASGERERYGYEYRVASRNGAEFSVQEIMLVGDTRQPGPEDTDLRRDGFVMVADGSERRYAYEGLSGDAIRTMKPGDELVVPMVERSDFGADAGRGEARGDYRIRFEGCSSIDVAGQTNAVKVFHVQSVGRAYDARAAGGPTDTTRTVWNRYWVSERHGLELRRDMPGGSMVATTIEEPA